MEGLFNNSALEKIQRAKKIFLWSAVCALIGVFLLGAILILSDGAGGVGMGKITATLFLVSVVLFVGVNNIVRIESNDKIIQGFGLASLICNLLWLIISILLIWEILPTVTYETSSVYFVTTTRTHLTAFSKIMGVVASLGAAGFWISNVLAIKETVRPVKPLKITAIVCEAYCSLFAIVVILSDMYSSADMLRWYLLSCLAVFAFVASACAAVIISKTNKSAKNVASASTNEPAKPTQKSEKELRAEIEEQVRREMIEKEVRARMEAEMGKKEGE